MANALFLSLDYIAELVLRVRALMAHEERAIPELGGNPGYDEGSAVLQETDDDLSRSSLLEDIETLDTDKHADLVAFMWLGRSDAEPEDWDSAYETACERHEASTAEYLLGQLSARASRWVSQEVNDSGLRLGANSSSGFSRIVIVLTRCGRRLLRRVHGVPARS